MTLSREVRRKLALVVLAVMLFAGLRYFTARVPADVDVAFEVPPVLRADPRSVARERIVRMEAIFLRREDAVEVARARLALGAGQESPLTAPTRVRLVPGRYVARCLLETADGVRLVRVAPLSVEGDGPLRVKIPGALRAASRSAGRGGP